MTALSSLFRDLLIKDHTNEAKRAKPIVQIKMVIRDAISWLRRLGGNRDNLIKIGPPIPQINKHIARKEKKNVFLLFMASNPEKRLGGVLNR